MSGIISKKEEERNEKIIRGLMKLPPNRRCINCNSLGPQYVCPNFWTFVCTTCSGIHREFTHRVKSVSMAKFTAQEVDALQRGGNQRAREIYLKDWDLQRQRLPDCSKVDKVREFIKNVYVNKKYAGGNTSDKPPRDTQGLRNFEDDTRRASSYHSYSQSPPYEHQYEDRKYGKQSSLGVLNRRPGSDRGISSFAYSPGRLAEQMYEDRFANEGSGSRASDYAFSTGDSFSSNNQSPNFQEITSSPPIHPISGRHQSLSCQDANTKKTDGARQRTSSLGSVGSFGSNSTSVKSFSSEPEQLNGTYLTGMPPVSNPVSPLDPFKLPPAQLSRTSSAPSMFETPNSFTPSMDFFKETKTSSYLVNSCFGDTKHQHLATAPVDQKPFVVSFPENEGWATFDLTPNSTSAPETKSIPHVRDTAVTPSLNTKMQWPSLLPMSNTRALPLDNQWHGNLHEVPAFIAQTSAARWDAFGDSTGNFAQGSLHRLPLKQEPQYQQYSVPSTANQHSESKVSEVCAPQQWDAFGDSIEDDPQLGIQHLPPKNESQVQQKSISLTANHFSESKVLEVCATQQWDAFGVSSGDIPQPGIQHLPLKNESQVQQKSISSSANQHLESKISIEGNILYDTDWKSTNPFDLPYESNLEANNNLFDISSLQTALPDSQLQPTFTDGLNQQWFLPEDPVTTYVNPAVPPGGFAYMAGESPAQFPNIPSQGPIASFGGNPFT